MKAIIWGSCGSLPTPIAPDAIRSKIEAAIWAARNEAFADEEAVSSFVDQLPYRLRGSYKGNTSCVQIDDGSDAVILCDAGSGIRDFAHTIEADAAPRTYHIFISHLHWDHIQGFPFFTPAYQPGNRIIFHGFHPDMEPCLRDQMKAPCFPVPFEAMQATIEFDLRDEGAVFELGELRVRSIKQKHPGDSWGYRFEKEGKSIVYSSDCEHGAEAKAADYPFVDFYWNADVLILDGQYTLEEAMNEKRDWGHSNHITAVELATRACAKQLVIFHHEPTYTDEVIESIQLESIQFAAQINRELGRSPEAAFPKKFALAHDGLILEA